jgi:hypothetical protein
MTRTFWTRLALAAFVLAESSAVASAATDVCGDLQARLDAVTRGNDVNANTYRVYDAQVSQQRAALDKSTNDARANGCYGGFFAPRPSAMCPQMLASINTMQASLAKLSQTRDQYRSDPYTLASQRNDILRLLSLNRCGNYAAYNSPPPSGGFFATLFGGGMFSPFGNGYYASPYDAYGGSTYRTLCVRSCDGYYFPISFSTTSDHFAGDQQMCQAMCPGAEVSLYVHHNPGEEVDSMVSLAGTPYSALPTAFKYRQTYDASCSCGSPTKSLMDQLTAQAAALTPKNGANPPVTTINIPSANASFTPLIATATGPVVPTPSLRPALSEDPETLADRAGRLTPAPVVVAPADAVAGLTADGRPIRIVGPAYYVAK